MSKPKAHEEILEVLKKHMKENPDGYINPNFMQLITEAVYDYYELDDDELDHWITTMFGY